jgi:hypothetical protein
MVAAGVDMKTAQHRLGHANVTMTLQVDARTGSFRTLPTTVTT